MADEPFLRALVVLLRGFDLVVAFALLDFGLVPFVLRASARLAFAFGLAVVLFVLGTVAPSYELTRLALNAGTLAAVGLHRRTVLVFCPISRARIVNERSTSCFIG